MSNNVAVQQPRSLDEFADWTDEVESHDEEISERAIIGQSVSFGNDGKFRLRDKSELTKPLIVANCRRVLTKWGKEKRPVETIFLKAGEKIPDLKKRNEETPKSEWVEGLRTTAQRPLAGAARRLPGRSCQHRSVHLSDSDDRRRHCRSRIDRSHSLDAALQRQCGLSNRAIGHAADEHSAGHRNSSTSAF